MGKDAQIQIKTAEEIEIMRQANLLVAKVLSVVSEKVNPGITTHDLDVLSEECCRDLGGIPAFKGYQGFPASLCTSVNEEVVHGIPSRKRFLVEGDIISLDFGVKYKGFFGDSAITVPVGNVKENIRNLLLITKESLCRGIAQAKAGNRVIDISRAVQEHVEAAGYSVVRQFVGHGIGSQLHEAPEVPNYCEGTKTSPRLLAGMVLAIEPMVNLGRYDVKVLKDNWTVVTSDKLPSAHFEHSIAVTDTGPYILSQM